MASKRKQDEKHLNLLRGMVKLEYNKQCFDCNQKGPTYVDMAVGAFVCTSCSGILRGLNPPHRVKSISMASFTPEEIEFIRARGNHFCQKVWLGLHNRSHFDFDNKDENKLRDFMIQKYEKKRFYVAPTEQMHEDARKLNTPAKPEPTTRPLRQVPKLAQNNIIVNQNKPPAEVPKPVSVQAPQSQPRPVAPQARIDLLSDLGGDPFQSQKPAAATNQPGFADFGNFGTVPSAQPTHPTVAAQPHPAAFPPASGLLTPMNSQASAQPPTSSQQQSLFGAFPASTVAPPSGGGDRYSALAELDSEFSKPPSTAPPVSVQWNSTMAGTGGGSIPWGGSAPMSSQSSSNASLLSTSPATSSHAAGFNAVANPFGGGPQPTSQASQPNPFAAAPGFNQAGAGFNQAGAGFNQGGAGFNQGGAGFSQAGAGFSQAGAGFSQAGFVQSPSGPGAGFGAQMGAMGAQSGAGQFVMPNGASGAPQGWGQPAPQGQMAPFGAYPSNSMVGAGGFGQKAGTPQGGAGAFGMVPQQQPQSFGSWGAGQPAANPFMNIASQAPAARTSNSTNPFL